METKNIGIGTGTTLLIVGQLSVQHSVKSSCKNEKVYCNYFPILCENPYLYGKYIVYHACGREFESRLK